MGEFPEYSPSAPPIHDHGERLLDAIGELVVAQRAFDMFPCPPDPEELIKDWLNDRDIASPEAAAGLRNPELAAAFGRLVMMNHWERENAATKRDEVRGKHRRVEHILRYLEGRRILVQALPGIDEPPITLLNHSGDEWPPVMVHKAVGRIIPGYSVAVSPTFGRTVLELEHKRPRLERLVGIGHRAMEVTTHNQETGEPNVSLTVLDQ